MSRRAVTLLGATGSIGQQALSVISLHADQFDVHALCANSNVDALFTQCIKFKPKYAVLADPKSADLLKHKLDGSPTKVLSGDAALVQMSQAPEVDIVVSGMVGAVGLRPTMAALQAGKQVLLANKESLVIGGPWMMAAAKENQAVLLPVDSEHNAIFQAMPSDYVVGKKPADVDSIILTASGGPFRERSKATLRNVSVEQALAHPTWSMGQKISIDSATMMNKGLEVIEAHWLFAMPLDQIEVVIHPQSIVHSLVRYNDGSLLAQMGVSDMRIPIGYALNWPQRAITGAPALDLSQLAELNFSAVELDRYPCLQLAFQALQNGIAATVVLNAANEIAVDAFLKQQISFTEIASTVERVLQLDFQHHLESMDAAIALDIDARRWSLDQLTISAK